MAFREDRPPINGWIKPAALPERHLRWPQRVLWHSNGRKNCPSHRSQSGSNQTKSLIFSHELLAILKNAFLQVFLGAKAQARTAKGIRALNILKSDCSVEQVFKVGKFITNTYGYDLSFLFLFSPLFS